MTKLLTDLALWELAQLLLSTGCRGLVQKATPTARLRAPISTMPNAVTAAACWGHHHHHVTH
jgi:hypothetical protein